MTTDDTHCQRCGDDTRVEVRMHGRVSVLNDPMFTSLCRSCRRELRIRAYDEQQLAIKTTPPEWLAYAQQVQQTLEQRAAQAHAHTRHSNDTNDKQ